MSTLTLDVQVNGLYQALLRAPAEFTKQIDSELKGIAYRIAQSAKRHAPKGGTTALATSIRSKRISAYEQVIGSNLNYARRVEEGTQGGYKGPKDSKILETNILDWIKGGSGVTPNDPDMTQEQLAWTIARSIAVKGTKPQPYLKPALEDNRARAERRISAVIDRVMKRAVE